MKQNNMQEMLNSILIYNVFFSLITMLRMVTHTNRKSSKVTKSEVMILIHYCMNILIPIQSMGTRNKIEGLVTPLTTILML